MNQQDNIWKCMNCETVNNGGEFCSICGAVSPYYNKQFNTAKAAAAQSTKNHYGQNNGPTQSRGSYQQNRGGYQQSQGSYQQSRSGHQQSRSGHQQNAVKDQTTEFAAAVPVPAKHENKKSKKGFAVIGGIAGAAAVLGGVYFGVIKNADDGSGDIAGISGSEAPEQTGIIQTTAPDSTAQHAIQNTTQQTAAAAATEETAVIDQQNDSMLSDAELENKTVKWLAHYDVNVYDPVAVSLFESTYGGKIDWIMTTWNNRYNDLSNCILGGQGIDIFPCDSASLPKGVVSGWFQPVDGLIDIDSDLWKDMKTAYEVYNFNGSHYEIVNNVTAEHICWYSKKTIAENGFDDPWELYKAGNWNWDTFESMLIQFMSNGSDRYGLDGWYNEKALLLSAGVTSVSYENGHLKSNLNDPVIERALNWQYDLYCNNLVVDQSQFGWEPQFGFMGSGKELFYLVGEWDFANEPETWNTGIAPEDLGAVPVPSPKGTDPYCAAKLNGWVVCKDAVNPIGAGLFADCTRLSLISDEGIEMNKQKLRDTAHWSDELIDRVIEIDDLAAKYPVVDLAAGVSLDVASITHEGGSAMGLRAPFHGYSWAWMRSEIGAVVEDLVAECDEQLANIS